MIHFTKPLLDKAKLENSLIVIDFFAEWCGPCRAFAPHYQDIATQLKDLACFGKVNIDEQRNLAVEYRITSIPTIIIIKNGSPVWAHLGSIDSETLKNQIVSLQ